MSSSVGLTDGSNPKIRKISSDQTISPVWTVHPKLPVWLSLCASARYACRRCNSWANCSCSVTSIAVPTILFKTPEVLGMKLIIMQSSSICLTRHLWDVRARQRTICDGRNDESGTQDDALG